MQIDSFQTTDGEKIHTVKWLVDNPKAVILQVHGIGEHSGRYKHVAEYFNQHGYSMYSLDHRGHGKSTGERAEFDSFEPFINDLKQYFDIIRSESDGLPIYIYGHSMGSMISTLFTLKYQNELAGFISSGSPLQLDTSVPGFLIPIIRFLGRVVPNLRLLGVENEALSSDPAVVADYVNDPLNNNKKSTLRVVRTFSITGEQTRKRIHTLTLPLLAIHGEADRLTPKLGSEFLYQTASSSDKKLIIYPEMLHEIHNEFGKEKVLQDITDWLDAHVKQTS